MKPKRQEDSSCVFAYRFCRGTCHRRDTAGKERAPKSLRRRSGKRSFEKAVEMARHDSHQGRGKLPPLYAAVRVWCRPYGVSRIPRSVAGRITGHRRSLPQPSSAAWCPPPLHWSRAHCPMWQRTDLAQVKRDRHTSKPRKARNTKAFRLRQSNSFAEIRWKRLSLPTGKVRPSEHDYDYKEISLYDHKRYLPYPRYPVGQAGAA